MNRAVLRKIRRSVKRELDRHDWASARTPSGKNLRRRFARLTLDSLSSGDKRRRAEACAAWDYAKLYLWKEKTDWGLLRYFIIEGIPEEYARIAKRDVFEAACKIARDQMIAEEDAIFLGDIAQAGRATVS